MPLKTGTLDIATLQAANNVTVAEFGEKEIAQILEADNRAFSDIVEDMIGDLVETSTDRLRPVGSSIGGNAVEVDEYGQSPTQKDVPGYFLGFPLKRIQFAIGWTKQWLKNAKAADVAVRNAIAQGAHLRRKRYELQKAIFTPTNYTFLDHLVDKAAIEVKAFVNADSKPIPNGPNGEVFDGATHTHFDGSATLTAAAVTAQIADITEHRNGATVRIHINTADVATFEALAGFVKLPMPYIVPGTSADHSARPMDITKQDNRQIGWFNGAEVWTKPWVPPFYSVAVDIAAPQKPLVRRVEQSDRGLHIAGEVESHPLQAEFAEWFYGFGAYNRLAVHVLKFNNATYSAPALSY